MRVSRVPTGCMPNESNWRDRTFCCAGRPSWKNQPTARCEDRLARIYPLPLKDSGDGQHVRPARPKRVSLPSPETCHTISKEQLMTTVQQKLRQIVTETFLVGQDQGELPGDTSFIDSG